MVSTFGESQVSARDRERLRHLPPDEVVRMWMQSGIMAADQGRGIVAAYLERHELGALPTPEYVSADTCYVYRPERDDGNVTGYRRIVSRGLPDSLISLLEKDFLLTPPAKGFSYIDASGDVVEVGAAPESGQAQSGTEETSQPAKKIHCDQKWSNGKTCGRGFASAGRLRRHIREKHASKEVTK